MHNHTCVGRVLATVTALTAATLVFGSAQSAPIGIGGGLPVLDQQVNPIEPAHYVWGGRGYCWHDAGWNGPGWYRCGYAARNGKGWGGPQGWHGWYWQGPGGPQHWGHHGWGHHRSGHHHGGQGCCW